MQTEEGLVCPSCGGENPKAAAFCWRCYASFSSSASASAPTPTTGSVGRPGVRIGVPPMPGPPTLPTPTTSGGSSAIVRILIGALVSLVVAFGVRTVLSGGGPSLPDTLAGTPRMTTEDVKDFEEEMAGYGERYGLDVAAGAYGTGVVPTFFVLLIDGRSAEETDAVFNEFVGGMTSSGATVETSALTSGERDGLEYRCVPVAAAQIQAAACMWRDDGSFGVVFRFDAGVEETTELLVRVHGEVV